MASALNLSLTDELRAFIAGNCGEGTLYATPSDFVRDLLRQWKAQIEAEHTRDAIVAGDQAAIAGRTVFFKGNLRSLLRKAQQCVPE